MGDAWKKYNLTSLHPGVMWSDVNVQEFSLFKEQRSEGQASTFLKQMIPHNLIFENYQVLQKPTSYLLIKIIPFDHKNSLVRQGRYTSKVRNLKSKDVRGFALIKRKKVKTKKEKVKTRMWVFLLLHSSKTHTELCLNLLNQYLVSRGLSFICYATNCGTEKLLHLY